MRGNAMSKTATKAADNIYYIARYEASQHDDSLSSREKAAEQLGIDRTRLARIELGSVNPFPDEVDAMARVYNSPELCNYYCSTDCPIGRNTVKRVQLDDFDRLSLKVLGALRDVGDLRDALIEVSEDGVVHDYEMDKFNSILESLDKIATTAQALSIWARKNVRIEESSDE